MLISIPLGLTVSAEDTTAETGVTKEEIILQQALAIDSKINQADTSFKVVSLNNSGMSTRANVDTEDKAIQKIENVDGEGRKLKVTTIFPYKVLPNGEMISSFDYAPVQARNKVPTTSKFVDVSVTTTVYYFNDFTDMGATQFYRHDGIEAYWSCNEGNATVESVSDMYIKYDTCGDLYRYPECLTQPLESTLVQNNYYIKSEIHKVNPVKSRTYANRNNAMPTNRVVHFTSYWEHGGVVYVKLTYQARGKTYTHDRSYDIYGK